jgi:hypothetical protein
MILWPESWVGWVNSRYFLVFFKIDFFFNFIHQYWVDWKLCFIIYFDFLYMGLFKPYDPSHEFGRLTWVNSSHFLFTFYKVILALWLESWVWHVYSNYFFVSFFNWFYFRLHPSILGWLRIEFHNLFWFALYEVIPISLLVSQVW